MNDPKTLAADRAAARELWPDLAYDTFSPIRDGWTCRTHEVDGEWIAQFPRTPHAEETLRRQRRVLPLLAGQLPAEMPAPLVPATERPLAMLYRKIAGTPATATTEGSWPEELGQMLRALQAIEPERVAIEPRSASELRAEREAQLDVFSERVLPLLDTPERAVVAGGFRDHVEDDANWQFVAVLTHGDLGPVHILVTDAGALAGVIDWEELVAKDPVTDVAWMLHAWPAIGRRIVAQLAVEPDGSFEQPAAFIYALVPFHEVIYGLDSAQPQFVASGLSGIRARMGLGAE